MVDGELQHVDVRQDLRGRGSGRGPGLATGLEPRLGTRQISGVDLHDRKRLLTARTCTSRALADQVEATRAAGTHKDVV